MRADSVDVPQGGSPAQRTGLDVVDELKHIAKLWVAASNPVVRSIVAGQGPFSDIRRRNEALLDSAHQSLPDCSLRCTCSWLVRALMTACARAVLTARLSVARS